MNRDKIINKFRKYFEEKLNETEKRGFINMKPYNNWTKRTGELEMDYDLWWKNTIFDIALFFIFLTF